MAMPIPKPPQKPVAVPKPGLFAGSRQAPVKELIGKAFKSSPSIPGTGGQIYPRQELAKALRELLPFQKFGSYLSEIEAKTILRKLRGEEYRAPKMTKN